MVPLPVELLYFEAELIQKEVMLTWTTASEHNNDYFEVQRSADGRLFETIGSVKGAGNSVTLLNYSFVDKKPLSGTNYYRLRQIDTDKQFADSKIITIVLNTLYRVKLYPNPAGNSAVIEFTTNIEEDVRIEVTDLYGRLLTSISDKITAAHYIIPIDVRGLKPGMYIIKITGRQQQQILKVQKLDE